MKQQSRFVIKEGLPTVPTALDIDIDELVKVVQRLKKGQYVLIEEGGKQDRSRLNYWRTRLNKEHSQRGVHFSTVKRLDPKTNEVRYELTAHDGSYN